MPNGLTASEKIQFFQNYPNSVNFQHADNSTSDKLYGVWIQWQYIFGDNSIEGGVRQESGSVIFDGYSGRFIQFDYDPYEGGVFKYGYMESDMVMSGKWSADKEKIILTTKASEDGPVEYESQEITLDYFLDNGILKIIDAENDKVDYYMWVCSKYAFLYNYSLDEQTIHTLKNKLPSIYQADLPEFTILYENTLIMAAISLRKIKPEHKNNYLNDIKQLIDEGNQINSVNVFGQSALHIAAAHSDTEVIQLLIEAGADPGLKDMAGQTPYDIAGLLIGLE